MQADTSTHLLLRSSTLYEGQQSVIEKNLISIKY